MTWPKWLSFGLTWKLPTFSKPNPLKLKPWSETDPDAFNRDAPDRAKNLEKFDTKRAQIIKELEEGK